MQSGKFTSSLSPQAYYQQFNKMVCEQQSYTNSDNPEMFSWRLNFQPLEQYSIPQVFKKKSLMKGKESLTSGKHENYEYQNNQANQYIKFTDELTAHQKHTDDLSNQQNRKPKSLFKIIEEKMDAKIIDFKDVEHKIYQANIDQKRSKIINKQKNPLKANSQHLSKIEQSLDSYHSQPPLDDLYKSSSLLRSTYRDQNTFLARSKQFQPYKTQIKIKPIYNQKVLLALKDSICQNKISKSKSQSVTPRLEPLLKQKIPSLLEPPTTTHLKRPSSDIIINIKPDIVDSNRAPKTRFTIKHPQKVSNLIQYIGQTYVGSEALDTKVLPSKEFYQIHDKLNQNLQSMKTESSSEGTKRTIATRQNNRVTVIDPKRNFLDFNTYFFKNYQIYNNGISQVLPQQLLIDNDNFVDNLQQIINQMK